jgi:hypothetical protein
MLSIVEYLCLFMSKLFCLILHTCVLKLSLFYFIQPYFYFVAVRLFGKCQTCFIYLALFIYSCPTYFTSFYLLVSLNFYSDLFSLFLFVAVRLFGKCQTCFIYLVMFTDLYAAYFTSFCLPISSSLISALFDLILICCCQAI